MGQRADDMTVYLRHIENAGKMCRKVQTVLKGADRPGRLCWYGDHVPIMPKVYEGVEFEGSATNYAVWHSGGSDLGVDALRPKGLYAHELGLALLGGME